MRTPLPSWPMCGLLACGVLLGAAAAGCGDRDGGQAALRGGDRRAGGGAAHSGAALAGVLELPAGVGVDPADFDCVFVMARGDPASPASEFVKMIPAPEFPLSFELTEADAMHAGPSATASYVVTARLDADGDAAPQPGDVQGTAAARARPGGPPVRVVLDQVLGDEGRTPRPVPADPHVAADPHAAGDPHVAGGAHASGVATAGAPAAGPFAGGAPASRFAPGEGPRFKGTIALDPRHAAMGGKHTLWIIVRSRSGAGAPIAVQRVQAASFPLEFDVGAEHTTTQSDDSYQILAGELKVTARLSLGGGAIAAPGDIECEPVIMKGDDPPASLTLDRQVAP